MRSLESTHRGHTIDFYLKLIIGHYTSGMLGCCTFIQLVGRHDAMDMQLSGSFGLYPKVEHDRIVRAASVCKTTLSMVICIYWPALIQSRSV